MSLALGIVAKSTIILLFATVLAALLRRSSASTKHTIWLLAISGSLALPAVVLLGPQFDWLVLPHTTTSVMFLPLAQPPIAAPATRLQPGAWEAGRIQLAWLWLFGFALLAARFARSAIAVRRLSASAEATPRHDWDV